MLDVDMLYALYTLRKVYVLPILNPFNFQSTLFRARIKQKRAFANESYMKVIVTKHEMRSCVGRSSRLNLIVSC